MDKPMHLHSSFKSLTDKELIELYKQVKAIQDIERDFIELLEEEFKHRDLLPLIDSK
ncbi:sporulation histidine kinase inhibitor Sda [Halalkalibacter krulwichiae]|uniref:Sporulation inhibitor A n=1 Tax=Halalkalibacter krulwichiae TaxID=199441 RepID=A0A1X9MH49_9BACI|nr:sporulation histidine kinase inhibitor Sda [Halalkalibacter krulwichiae]ARK31830.1 hypothetical protein BkAM31D_19430 [Halalkalibacter krulwichiae]